MEPSSIKNLTSNASFFRVQVIESRDQLPRSFTLLNVSSTLFGVSSVVGSIAAFIFGQIGLGTTCLGIGLLAVEEGVRSMLNRRATILELKEFEDHSANVLALSLLLSNLTDSPDDVECLNVLIKHSDEMSSGSKKFSPGVNDPKLTKAYKAVEALNKNHDQDHLNTAVQAIEDYGTHLADMYNKKAKSLGSRKEFFWSIKESA